LYDVEGDLFATILVDVPEQLFRQGGDGLGEIEALVGRLSPDGGFFKADKFGWAIEAIIIHEMIFTPC
jgi:hypothetical protein